MLTSAPSLLLAPARPFLSDQEEGMLKEPFVPSAWPYLPIAAMAAAQAHAANPNLEPRRRWNNTKPLAPFEFETRDKDRPMSIMQARMCGRRKFSSHPLFQARKCGRRKLRQ